MLEKILKEFNIETKKIEKLNKLRELVIEYNKHTNLTSITDIEEFNIKHILDSIYISKYYQLDNKNILDLGSGGGFPGLVLAIIYDSSKVKMLDSNKKKTDFVDFAISELNLKNAKTIHSRAEEYKNELFDIVVSRAVAPLNVLIEISSNLVEVNGKVIFYKGSNIDVELPKSWKNFNTNLGLYFDKQINYQIRENKRTFISLVKKNKNKEGYPRMYGQIKKSPIQ